MGEFIDYCGELWILEPAARNIESMRRRIDEHVKRHNRLLESFHFCRKYNNISLLNVLEHVEDPIQTLAKLPSIVRDEALIYASVPS